MSKKRYRLLVGTHIESVPTGRQDRDGNTITEDKVYRAMDPKKNVIETEEDLEKMNCPSGALGDAAQYRKYELLHNPEQLPGLPTGALVFDSSKETLEQFTARAQRAANPILSTPQVWDPTKESLTDFAERMAAGTKDAAIAASPSMPHSFANQGNSAVENKPTISVADAAKAGFNATSGNAKSSCIDKDEDRKPLTSMSDKELLQLAENEEIDLKGAKTKDAIIKVFKAAGY